MMGMQVAAPQLFYDFCLDDYVPGDHLLRRIDRFVDLESVRAELRPFYSTIGRPSIDPDLVAATAWASVPNGGSVRKSISISRIAGSVGSVWTARCRITRPSRAIATSPLRPRAVRAAFAAARRSSAKTGSVSGVGKNPGAIALQVTPAHENSSAIARVSWTIPPFAAP